MKQFIRITKPITRRAKNRVFEHGSIFRVIPSRLASNSRVLVESLDKKWQGWFYIDEAIWEYFTKEE